MASSSLTFPAFTPEQARTHIDAAPAAFDLMEAFLDEAVQHGTRKGRKRQQPKSTAEEIKRAAETAVIGLEAISKASPAPDGKGVIFNDPITIGERDAHVLRELLRKPGLRDYLLEVHSSVVVFGVKTQTMLRVLADHSFGEVMKDEDFDINDAVIQLYGRDYRLGEACSWTAWCLCYTWILRVFATTWPVTKLFDEEAAAKVIKAANHLVRFIDKARAALADVTDDILRATRPPVELNGRWAQSWHDWVLKDAESFVQQLWEAGHPANSLCAFSICTGTSSPKLEFTEKGWARLSDRTPRKGLNFDSDDAKRMYEQLIAESRLALSTLERTPEPEQTGLRLVRDEPAVTPQLRWDEGAATLYFCGTPIRQFKQPAANQRLVLQSFEELGWPAFISDPIPGARDTDSAERVRQTVANLNKGITQGHIKFTTDGRATGFGWKLWQRAR